MAQIVHANGPSNMPFQKYREFNSFAGMTFDDKWKARAWPNNRMTQAPRWCSVDLRDGNQALVNPMNHEKKLRFWRHLLSMGFKDIEVGFPAASQTDFDFCRFIIDNKMIPDDVYIQVLCQCREDLIKRTIEALAGAKNVVVHIYNSTSELQRRVVFDKDRAGIKALAEKGARLVKSMAEEQLIPLGCNVRYEYSPESFTGTELEFALDVCEAVVKILAPDPQDKMIINLPATVEMAGPNVYADQIEWMCAHFSSREKLIVSVHPHNDRGCGVAAAELAVLAGADRVEGCLFGNGERTGNVCLVTLAMNLFTQGIDPEIDLSNIQKSIDVAEYCNELRVPERYPWAGSLVYTAFSGSHQDAIRKGMTYVKQDKTDCWEVPYLPVDPAHIGRTYEALIRVNSQSGKGGIFFLLEKEYGISLPKDAQAAFSQVIQDITDRTKVEISPLQIYDAFQSNYINQPEGFRLLDFEVSSFGVGLSSNTTPASLMACTVASNRAVLSRDAEAADESFESLCSVTANVQLCGKTTQILGSGNGPINAFISGLETHYEEASGLEILDYSLTERGASKMGDQGAFVCSIACSLGSNSKKQYGVGMDTNTNTASAKAVLSSLSLLVAAHKTTGAPHSRL